MGSKLALAAFVSLLVTLAPAAAAHAESSGTARGFALVVSPRAVGFLVQIENLLGLGTGAGESVFAERTQSGSTAEDWRAAREAKRDNLSVSEKTGIEAGLAWLEDGHWLQRIRGGWHGFLPIMGGFPSGSGQAFGVVWSKMDIGARYPDELTPNRVGLRGSLALSLRGYYLGLFEVGVARIGGAPIHMNFHVGFQHNANESFYGFGQDSSLDDRVSFAQNVGAAGLVLW